jgi:NAD(P)-dependent dehydrogenase (short-subunit alcohol dehydrogenase family)
MAADRVAIVTGANGMRGIGRAIALRFAREGLDIALVDIERPAAEVPEPEREAGWRGIESVQAEIAALGRRTAVVFADITHPDQVDYACRRTVEELGRVDVLVNSARASIGRDRAPVIELERGAPA